MLRILTPLLAAAALAVAGCGGSSSNSSSSSSSSATPSSGAATTSSSSSTSGSSGGAVTVHMKNIAFDPKSVTVKKGQTIKWVNDDTVGHDVVAQQGASFKSSTFGKGGSYTFKATKAGTIQYVCTLHPGMDGTIIVQ